MAVKHIPIGTYTLPGRVRDPVRALAEAQVAEEAGFSRVWLAERYDLKEAGVLLGAMAATTTSVGLGTAVLATQSRSPLMMAALGATMQETFGPRLALGLGRGLPDQIFHPLGLRRSTYGELEDYVTILRRLWDGETVTYDGPLGSFPALRLADVPTQPRPELVLGARGGRRAVEVAAKHFDSVMLSVFFSEEAVREAVIAYRTAAESIGRDPSTLKIYHQIVAAPEMSDDEVVALAHARAVTYFQLDGHWQGWAKRNKWDTEPFLRIQEAFRQRAGGAVPGGSADQAFHREELLEFARMVPDEWMYSTSVIGSVDECIATLDRYAATGIDELMFHGAPPAQTANVVRAWNARTVEAAR